MASDLKPEKSEPAGQDRRRTGWTVCLEASLIVLSGICFHVSVPRTATLMCKSQYCIWAHSTSRRQAICVTILQVEKLRAKRAGLLRVIQNVHNWILGSVELSGSEGLQDSISANVQREIAQKRC